MTTPWTTVTGRPGRTLALLVAVTAIVAVAVATPRRGNHRGGASAAAGLAGGQGTNGSLPDTPSSVQRSGSGAFAGLTVKVNQTQDLVNQAVSVTWSGAPPSFTSSLTGQFTTSFGGNFLQLFECWSASAATPPTPEQCEFGGQNANGGYPVTSHTDSYTRVLAETHTTCGATAPPACLSYAQATSLASTSPKQAFVDDVGFVVDPFQAVDGTLVNQSVDYLYNSHYPYTAYDLNPYFSSNTTNEIDFSRTYADGTGQQLFQVDTGLEAPGLGCGQSQSDGSVPQCWLVVVPRGTPAHENPEGDASPTVTTSPLVPSAWANRIAFPLAFQPIGTSCALTGTVRRINGDETAGPAVANWQPTICAQPGAPSYTYTQLSDDNVRGQFGTAGVGMSVASRPLDPATLNAADPVVYAPLTLSGAVIAFSIRRVPAFRNGQPLPDELPFSGTPVTTLRLTPLLVAKLLTLSYGNIFFSQTGSLPANYAWATKNPHTLLDDSDFLAYNPEFTELETQYPIETAGLVVEQQSSDAAYYLWQWVLADNEAKQWLNGTPDAHGMVVNADYSTNPSLNPSGTAFQPSDSFPKADPYCYKSAVPITGTNIIPRDLCIQDWEPYASSTKDAAGRTLSGNTGRSTTINGGALDSATAWVSDGPQQPHQLFVLSITDTPQAQRFGLQTAMLSQAGDDGANRSFIAPDSAGLTAGYGAMTTGSVPGVKLTNAATTAPGAYPLTMLTYAATTPLDLNASTRADYASFVKYAAGPGQVPGLKFGSLPPGYVSLPADSAAQASAAAASIVNLAAPTTTTTTVTTAPPPPSPTPATTASAAAPTALAAVPSPPSAPAAPAVRSSAGQRVSGPLVGGAAQAAPAQLSSPTVPTFAPPAAAAPQLASVRSPRTGTGAVQFLVPLLIALGAGAAFGARRLSKAAPRTGAR
jgi:hypothetical protein